MDKGENQIKRLPKPFDALILLFAAFAVGSILGYLIGLLPIAEDISVYLQYAMTQVGMLGAFIVYLKLAKVDSSGLAVRVTPKLLPSALTVVMSIGALAAFMILNYSAVYLFDALGWKVGVSLPVWDSWYDVVLALVCICALPAFGEELLFRGAAYGAMKVWGGKVAILLSALLFSLFHFNLAQTVYQLAYALFLGYVVAKTDCIWYAVMLHFFNNLWVQLLVYLPAVNTLAVFSLQNLGVLFCISCIGIGITTVSTLFFLRATGETKLSAPAVQTESVKKENVIYTVALTVALATVWLVMVISNVVGVR